MSNYLAIDLGAESGRVILGQLKAGKFKMKEVHRFSNGAITANGTLRWDIIRIFREIRVGLAKGSKLGPIKSVACDSWGVDYVLLKGDGPLLSLPFTYRDERSFKSYELAIRRFSQKEIFEGTGIASISINTLYQLFDDAENRPEMLRFADKFLLIGDYITWLLTGKARAEETLISGSQCWDTRKRDWAWPVLKKLGIPKHIFPKPVAPGVKLGKMLPYLAKETGLGKAEIWAIRLEPGMKGDVSKSHVAWSFFQRTPKRSSPVIVNDLLFMANDGVLSCVDAKTGKSLWAERAGGEYSASMIAAGDRVYCFDEVGLCTVVKAAATYKVLAENRFEEGFMASPAASGDALILRPLGRLDSATSPALR